MLCRLVSSLEVLLSLEGAGETRRGALEAHSQDWRGGGGRENRYHDCWPNSYQLVLNPSFVLLEVEEQCCDHSELTVHEVQ